jgi:dTDP-4-amino-4,6-dideoxygalactose transaminase
MRIPFIDLRLQYENLKESIDAAIKRVIEDSSFIGGKYVTDFENEFARKYGVKNFISTANGTDSLYIIMRMLGIGPGDEVITVANSWISSSETITQCGAKPVFVDIDPVFYTIDENKIEEKINSSTKAIMPVHLFGQMCEMAKIKSIVDKHNLFLVEDCAQSHFSEFNGQRAGTFGIAGSFSFYPGKNLGAYGDAGGIIANDDTLAVNCKMFSRHGCLVKHDHKIEGINSRLDGLQAAVLSIKLNYIDEWTEKRIRHASLYSQLLTSNKNVIIPAVRPNTKHSFHLYVVRVKERQALQNHLKECGIETAIHYPAPLPFLPAYAYLHSDKSEFPVSYLYKDEILSLPLFPELLKGQIEYIVHSINRFYGS